MVAGTDGILFRPDDELRKLATKAHQLGLSQRFLATPIDRLDQLLTMLGDTPEGREWLAAFEAAKNPWFYLSSRSSLSHDHIAWIDDLRLPLATIRDYIKQLTFGQSVEHPLEQLREERERIVDEYRQLLPSDAERQQFDLLLQLARTVFPFVEEHNFSVEHWSGTIFWRHMRQLDRILAETKAFGQPGGLCSFNPEKLECFLFDFTSAWTTGIPMRGRREWKDRLARRKEIIAVLREWTPVPCQRSAVKQAIIEAGHRFGLRQVGSLAYFTTAFELGWIPRPLPAIYTGEELRPFREWLPATANEATWALGGSFASPNVEDYYLTPWELGYGHLVQFDHDFIGRAALERMANQRHRVKVSLVWDPDDVAHVVRSYMDTDQRPAKYIEFPLSTYATWQYDAVLDDQKRIVGISTDVGFSWNERAMVSLAVLDPEYAVPGTRVTVLWGEPDGGARSRPWLEPHRQVEIRATVAPVPLSEYARAHLAAARRGR